MTHPQDPAEQPQSSLLPIPPPPPPRPHRQHATVHIPTKIDPSLAYQPQRSYGAMMALALLFPIHFFFLRRQSLGVWFWFTTLFGWILLYIPHLIWWFVNLFLVKKWVFEHNQAVLYATPTTPEYRSYLESDEPDATGRWDPTHRARVLSYIHHRDGQRCGVCGGTMKLEGAQVEHIVPKIFPFFNVTPNGHAHQGTHFASRYHKLDNLQAAHTYCNQDKGNTPDTNRWRSPMMQPLTVAKANDGSPFKLPVKLDSQTETAVTGEGTRSIIS